MSRENYHIYLADIQGYNPDTSQTQTYCFTNAVSFVTEPNDTPANRIYEPRILQTLNFEQSIFEDGKTAGRSRIGFGEVVLKNPDGELDSLLNVGFSGREIKIRSGNENTAYSAMSTFFIGTVEQPEFTWNECRFRVRDRLEELNKPVQSVKYAGTNSGPDGVEGTPDDIKDRPKPLCYGRCLNASPESVNTSKLIYQIHDGRIEGIQNIYDSGMALTDDGVDHADLSGLQNASIAGGHFRTCLNLGLFRLGGSPAGAVTVDVRGCKAQGIYVDTVADIIERIVKTKGGFGDTDIDSSSFETLKTINASEVGIFINEETTIAEILDRLCASIGAFYSFSRLGRLYVGRFTAPAQGEAYSYTEDDVLNAYGLERLATNDEGRGIPAFKINLKYQKNWTTQTDGDLASGVPEERKAWLKQEFRLVSAEDAQIRTVHLLAPELEFESLLTNMAHATAEAQRLMDLYKVRRDRYKIRLRAEDAASVNLGDTIKVTLDRFDLRVGKRFVVLGMAHDLNSQITELDVWG